MWNVLGEKAIYLDIPYIFTKRMGELAGEGEVADRFRECLNASNIEFMINPESEECSFMVYVPDDLAPEDIQTVAETALSVAQAYDSPLLMAEDTEQRYKIIFTNNKEPELLGLNRTEGFGSGQVFMPIFESLSKQGRMNPKFQE
ncbi:MAG TPA: hypothetical protein VJY42_00710 [Candidatus Methanomethylophilaceae archaeon]|nr:hypothetical protein [Candidatus Methanomethylophilaceae archaeon]